MRKKNIFLLHRRNILRDLVYISMLTLKRDLKVDEALGVKK